jgi:hypothetical protein
MYRIVMSVWITTILIYAFVFNLSLFLNIPVFIDYDWFRDLTVLMHLGLI